MNPIPISRQLQRIEDLKMESKIMKLLEDNRVEYYHNLGVGNSLLNGTQNAPSKKSNIEKIDYDKQWMRKVEQDLSRHFTKEAIQVVSTYNILVLW